MAIDEDCKEIMKATGTMVLVKAIKRTEGVQTISLRVLRGLGLSTTSGTCLLDCTTAADSAASRKEIAQALMQADSGLKTLAPEMEIGEQEATRMRNSLVEITRGLADLMNRLRSTSSSSDSATGQPGVTSFVVTQTEEERGSTLTSLTIDDVKKKYKEVSRLYNIRMRQHEKIKHSMMKRVGHWVKNEGSFPDPDQLSYLALTSQRASDGPYCKFKRMMYAVLTLTVGDAAGDQLRDDGAGAGKKTKKGKLKSAQWASGYVVQDLLSEIDEWRDELTAAEMETLCTTLSMELFKGTSIGKETLSLSMSRAMSSISHTVMHLTHVRAKKKEQQPRQPQPGSKRDLKRKREAEKKKETEGPAAKAQKEKAGDTPAKERYPDTAGAPGPNGKPRMVGGNPEGGPCKLHAAGNCPYKTCSFRH